MMPQADSPALNQKTRDRRDAALDLAESALRRARAALDVAVRVNAPGYDPKDNHTIAEIDRALSSIAELRKGSAR